MSWARLSAGLASPASPSRHPPPATSHLPPASRLPPPASRDDCLRQSASRPPPCPHALSVFARRPPGRAAARCMLASLTCEGAGQGEGWPTTGSTWWAASTWSATPPLPSSKASVAPPFAAGPLLHARTRPVHQSFPPKQITKSGRKADKGWEGAGRWCEQIPSDAAGGARPTCRARAPRCRPLALLCLTRPRAPPLPRLHPPCDQQTAGPCWPAHACAPTTKARWVWQPGRLHRPTFTPSAAGSLPPLPRLAFVGVSQP